MCDEPQTDDTLGRLLYQLFQTKKSAKAFGERKRTMKIIAYDRMKPGVTYETIEPYFPEEVPMFGDCGKPESYAKTMPAQMSSAW